MRDVKDRETRAKIASRNRTIPCRGDHAAHIIILQVVVPSSGLRSNQNKDSNPVPVKDSNSLFDTLANWNAILEGLGKQPTGNEPEQLPQSKKRRPSPPVRRRHKKMMGGVS
jgi:hypothetical protein